MRSAECGVRSVENAEFVYSRTRFVYRRLLQGVLQTNPKCLYLSNNSGYFDKRGPQRCGQIEVKGTGKAVKYLRKA